ncbi:PTPLA-domain-containing protein [Pleomassaria siparia CBS 279.74]|uniref:Very-long-chain (3R)-3-hydroxyacyl-CoA dehydratase n=1 Tax=Pleomassaria siparia CBS 279.74 TaxID=1314801 RepID=A0A6G1KA56_9PLEO|nr:PTPLA-domain-containing protein [Pleomassaria siparia CBS 279.74]
MARPKHPANGQLASPGPRTDPRILYLTFYNISLFILWISVFVSVSAHARLGASDVFNAISSRVRWIQTLSFIEVVHTALRIVKSPVSTTFIQNFTRVVQVWLWYFFPEATGKSYAFLLLVLAWSVADSVRYLYLTLHLHGRASDHLAWLRYSMFIPLYPVGIGSEWWLMYKCIEPLSKVSDVGPWIFWFLLMLYVPGAYTMFNHMLRQRWKTLGRQRKDV